MKTNDFIKQLSSDVKPVKRLASPGKRFFIWFLASFFSISLGISLMGIRSDFSQALMNPRFVLETLAILAIAILAAAGAFMMSVPGMGSRPIIRWLLIIPSIAWPLSLAYRLYTIYSQANSFAFIFDYGFGCIRDIFLLGILPGSFLFFMLKTAAPLRLSWTGALATLSAAAIAAVGVQFTCSADSPVHIFLWHVLPVIVIGVAGIGLGKHLLRW
jgi:hypothetical protein